MRILSRIDDMRFCRGARYSVGLADSGRNSGGQAFSNHGPLMCRVPLEAEVDDVFVVIHGFRIPMLIRRQPGVQERYRFLGVCFVYGFMDGEALETNGLSSSHIIMV